MVKAYYKQPGFTIVELLVVIVVIGVLATITVVAYTGISNKATEATLQSDLKGASRLLEMYKVDNGEYPTSNDCSSTPAAKSICLKSSPGNSYGSSYSPNNSSNPPTYTLDATNTNGTVYNITNDTAPTVAVPTTIPGQPTGLVAVSSCSGMGDEQITLNWSAPSSDGGSSITNYKVYRGVASNTETLFATLGNVTTYLNTGVGNLNTRYYKISAQNSVGEGPNSAEASATTGNCYANP